MKNLIKSIKLTLVFVCFCPYVMCWSCGRMPSSPRRVRGGNVETVTLNGKVVGVANVGQRFTQDIYFWGRPSCAGDGYDGTSSAGSNKGVTNESYLKEVEARIDTFCCTIRT